MGGSQSTPIPGGGTHGYHVLKVQEQSPAYLSKLEAYFDFIVTIQGLRLDQESDTLIEILKAHLDREVKLGVYNIKARSWREVGLIPNTKWGGQGVIGVSIRFCSFENVSENIWHILEVYTNSPAEKAGIISNTDYIIGYEMMDEEFDSFIEHNNRREVKLFVYNVVSDKCRDVFIIPDQNWGGEGSLGCGVGTGYLHRIPNLVKPNTPDKNLPHKSDVEVGDKRDSVGKFTNVDLLPISPQRKNDKPQPNIENKQIEMEQLKAKIPDNNQTIPAQNIEREIPNVPPSISRQNEPPIPINEVVTQTKPQETPPSTNQDPKLTSPRQDIEKKSPIPTASQKNLFTTQISPHTFISPSSGLPTAPPTEFNLEIPQGAFHHSQQPIYHSDSNLKPMPGGISQPNYTAASPPSIDEFSLQPANN